MFWWRYRCYKLKNELEMTFSMLITMDSKDSLKRLIPSKNRHVDEALSNAKEFGDYFIVREDVDKWGNLGSTNMYLELVVQSPLLK